MQAKSQRANHWVFGDSIHFTFDNLIPAKAEPSAMVAPNGSSCISDENGELLYYSDGETIWNRNHDIMKNGDNILGSNINAQPALFIKQPGTNSLYYLFTTNSRSGESGFRYNIIDASLDNGLGEVISKNNLLFDSDDQKVTATYHSNSVDVWIAGRKDDEIYTYLLTDSGLSATPVISGGKDTVTYDKRGMMKFSPDGTRLAVALTYLDSSFVKLYHFDASQGIASNYSKLVMEAFDPQDSTTAKTVYGLSFTSRSDLVYASTYDFDNEQKQGFINGFRAEDGQAAGGLGAPHGSPGGTLQLGPNGSLYYLSVGDSVSRLVEIITCANNEGGINFGSAIIFGDLPPNDHGLPNFNDSDIIKNALTPVDAGPDVVTCNRTSVVIGEVPDENFDYSWTPDTGLDYDTIANPTVQIQYTGTEPDTLTFILTKSPSCLYGSFGFSKLTGLIRNSDTVSVIITPELSLEILGQEEVCNNDLIQNYKVGAKGLSNYTWTIANGTVLSGQWTDSVMVAWDKDAVDGQVSVIVRDNYGCNFEQTLDIGFNQVTPMEVEGSSTVCPNVTGVDYFINNVVPGTAYRWSVQGGALVSGQGSPAIKVDWGDTNFDASVDVIAADQNGCMVAQTFPVKVKIQLEPDIPVGADSVCYNFRDAVSYETSYSNGSVYTWNLTGGEIVQGQGTSEVVVSWDGVGNHKLWVEETSITRTDVCDGVSDTLSITVFKDEADITLDFVTIDLDDETMARINFQISMIERINDLLVIYRRVRGDSIWTEIGRVSKDAVEFIDSGLKSDELIYEYKIEGFNKCDEGLKTEIHNTILLEGDNDQDSTMYLTWNNDSGWPETEHYEIWRKLDEEDKFSILNVVAGNQLQYISFRGDEGFNHMIRIRAKQIGRNNFAWSNDISLDFDHKLWIPNVVTPNGDHKNDTFELLHLELFPYTELEVFNRSGKMVFFSHDYQNDWEPDLPSGIYYYVVKTIRDNRVYKGWIQILR